MIDFFWVFRSKRCAVCGETGTAIELTIRYAGKKDTDKWFCTYKHLTEWWGKEYCALRGPGKERTKVIVVKK